MIEVTRLSSSIAADPDRARAVKIIAVGGAGSNILDRIILDGFDKNQTLAANTDVQALTACLAGQKIQLGRETTRGLGTGGDPDYGRAAAEESIDSVRDGITGVSLVVICAGLGGGTGSGATPLIAEIARETRAVTIAIVTKPFAYEGPRRKSQAEESLQAIRDVADFVICFENDRMDETVPASAGIHQAFTATDHLLSQCIRTLAGVFQKPGLLRIGFDELASVVRDMHEHCVFGYGEADGENRAHDAIARALKSPLMDKGKLLEQSRAVLVSITGGPNMTLLDAEILMTDLGKFIEDDTLVHLGITIDPKLGQKMSVAVLGGFGHTAKAAPATAPAHRETTTTRALAPESEDAEPDVYAADEQSHSVVSEEPEPAPTRVPPPRQPRPAPARPERTPDTRRPLGGRKADAIQENLPLEPVSRGRFDKSEPTIVDGEDLDVPTFLRRNLKLK